MICFIDPPLIAKITDDVAKLIGRQVITPFDMPPKMSNRALRRPSATDRIIASSVNLVGRIKIVAEKN
ncbi:hypothetical protein [Mycolicibacter hiberniae]|uniref:hypothetical protein n=1 Tax=Mycolicibacter hiberniae TaxID=29314 RepID=UPI0010555675|nr:hypothetical protein [Mycolicibacter hiberniae]MCV7085621.1 hypothetical protein [Mycolicibacter hiberniae]